MTTWNVEEDGGGDYTTLASALSNASTVDDDIIDIRLEWDNDDTAAAEIVDDLTIQTSSAARHPGYWNEALKHYRLVVSSGSHALTLNGAHTATIDGLSIDQASATTSAECFRCVPGTADVVTIKNSILLNTGGIEQQDGIYTGANISRGDITCEQCVFVQNPRAGINIANSRGGAGFDATTHVNSCTFWNNGHTPGDSQEGGGIVAAAEHASSMITINVQNSIFVENNADVQSFDLEIIHTLVVLNISNSIDSDGSIATHGDTGSDNLASRTATDDTSPVAGDWVIFQDITTAPYNLRLAPSVENDAQDMHTTATAHSLTIPSKDIRGSSRPQNVSFDCGAHEILVFEPYHTRQIISHPLINM